MGCGSSAPSAPVTQAPPKKRHHHHHHHHKKHKAKKAEAEDAALAEVAREEMTKETGNFWWPTVEPGGTFDAWVRAQLQNSPDDAKDADNYKFISFSELPPFISKHTSLMRNVLTPELFEDLKDQKTSGGYTLSNAMQAGVLYPRLDVGFTCGDEESYSVFKAVIQPMVREIHGFQMGEDEHVSDLDASKLSVSEEQVKKLAPFVKSIRARGARNISGFALPPGAQSEDRLAVEALLREVLDCFPSELAGTYTSLADLNAEETAELQRTGMLFSTSEARDSPLAVLQACGARRAWPEGRGLFLNESRSVACWCNEEEHCKLIALQEGCDVAAVFSRYCALAAALQDGLSQRDASLMKSQELGFLTSSPENVGTGLKFSVEIELPAMSLRVPQLETACKELGLVLDGSAGKGTAARNSRWQISNRQSVGVSEVQIVNKVVEGVLRVVELEQAAVAGEEQKEDADDDEGETKEEGGEEEGGEEEE